MCKKYFILDVAMERVYKYFGSSGFENRSEMVTADMF